MAWTELLSQGLAVGLLFLLVRGDLRLAREVTSVEKSNTELKDELSAVVAKSEKAVIESQEATRQQMVELTKTNAELVAALASKDAL